MEASFITGSHDRHAFHAAQLSPTAHILDLASGTGIIAFTARFSVEHITATDFSDGMVRLMTSKAERLGLLPSDRMTIERRDMTDLSVYEDEQFDAVFCMFGVIGAVSDKHRQWVADISRVLKPGGKLVMGTWPDFTRSQYHTVMFGAVRVYLSQGAAAPMFAQPNAAAAPPNPATRPANFDNERDMTTLLTPHFTTVNSHTVTLPYGRSFHGGRDFWLSAKGAMPMLVPASDVEVERRADEAAIAWLDSVMGRNSDAMMCSTSIITTATK